MGIHSVEMGRSMLQQRLLGKRVLIVLDNIDEKGPLLDLRRNHAWLNKVMGYVSYGLWLCGQSLPTIDSNTVVGIVRAFMRDIIYM